MGGQRSGQRRLLWVVKGVVKGDKRGWSKEWSMEIIVGGQRMVKGVVKGDYCGWSKDSQRSYCGTQLKSQTHILKHSNKTSIIYNNIHKLSTHKSRFGLYIGVLQ